MSNIYITSRMEEIKRKYDKLRQKVILGHVLKKKINKNHITKKNGKHRRRKQKVSRKLVASTL